MFPKGFRKVELPILRGGWGPLQEFHLLNSVFSGSYNMEAFLGLSKKTAGRFHRSVGPEKHNVFILAIHSVCSYYNVWYNSLGVGNLPKP